MCVCVLDSTRLGSALDHANCFPPPPHYCLALMLCRLKEKKTFLHKVPDLFMTLWSKCLWNNLVSFAIAFRLLLFSFDCTNWPVQWPNGQNLRCVYARRISAIKVLFASSYFFFIEPFFYFYDYYHKHFLYQTVSVDLHSLHLVYCIFVCTFCELFFLKSAYTHVDNYKILIFAFRISFTCWLLL